MIYVRIEMWPGGDRSRARLLGDAVIANVTGVGRTAVADYRYELRGKGQTVMNTGGVREFPRLRFHAWDLLYRVLHSARGRRNGH